MGTVVKLGSKTELTKDNHKAQRADLAPGARVVVDVPEGSKDKIAHSVKSARMGLVLAPGFIDTHNHSTGMFEGNPGAESQVSQGITTMLLGQDGVSPLPISGYLKSRRDLPAPVNFQMLVGHA